MVTVADVINLPNAIATPDAEDGRVTVYAESGKVLTLLPDGVVTTEQMFPCHASLFIDEAVFTPGLGIGGITLIAEPTIPYQLWGFQSATASVGDRLTWRPLLKAGTYRLRTFGQSQSINGITATQVNGVTVASIDWYNAVAFAPDVREHTGITIPNDGVQEITFRVTGKNASASNFFFVFSAILMTRTGA